LSRQRPPVPLFSSSSNNILPQTQQLPNVANMADLHSNNSFDSGASLMPAFQAGGFTLEQVSAFTAINDPSVASGSTRTVSPKDIFADAFGSAPPSAAFTNLTSPDIDVSPFINDSFETSPMFQGEPMLTNTNDWFSLFPEEENKLHELKYAPAVPLPMERTVSSQSMERSGSSSMGSPLVLDTSSFRRKSSVTNSPSTNGISKSRRRKGTLPAITVDPNDKIALKRARNTLAARESRQRKFDHVSELEARNADLEAEIEKWKNIALAHGYTGA
jgi:general control protein GCN4